MKKLLLAWVAITTIIVAGSACAADRGGQTKGPEAAFSWTGGHIGINAGLANGHTSWKDPVPIGGNIDATPAGRTAHTDMSGGIYGVQGGYDWQFDNWVVGLEGSFSALTLSGTNIDQFNHDWTLRAKTEWIGSLTGRVGWAVRHVLLYGRGGVAWAHNKFEIEDVNTFRGSPSATRVGFVVGAGFEWAFAPGWSVFSEAGYDGFHSRNVTFSAPPEPSFDVRTRETIETLRFGVNFRF